MAYHLERHPKVHAVVNFVPVLLDQLEDYETSLPPVSCATLARLLAHKIHNLTGTAAIGSDACFRSNHTKMIALSGIQTPAECSIACRRTESRITICPAYMSDLLTWYHLAWCGECAPRTALVAQLMSKEEGFSHEDRKQLLGLIGKLIGDIIPRYRKLAESGQIEISTTPHYHPLAPLLIDFASAKEAMPDAPLPNSPHYPKGRMRVIAHVRLAKKSYRQRFGAEPQGMWPAEGSISSETLEVLAAEGCRWTASSESVLVNSLRKTRRAVPERAQYLYRPYRLEKGGEGLHYFFRDDHLSDLIGFEYSRWHGKDAASHFIGQIVSIAQHAPEDETPVVSVILDGENAWEYYPYNGYYFIDELYSALETMSRYATTYSDYLEKQGIAHPATDRPYAERALLQAVGSTAFSTWMTHPTRIAHGICCASPEFRYGHVQRPLSPANGRRLKTALLLRKLRLVLVVWRLQPHSVASFDRLFRCDRVVPPAGTASAVFVGTDQPRQRLPWGGGAMRPLPSKPVFGPNHDAYVKYASKRHTASPYIAPGSSAPATWEGRVPVCRLAEKRRPDLLADAATG